VRRGEEDDRARFEQLIDLGQRQEIELGSPRLSGARVLIAMQRCEPCPFLAPTRSARAPASRRQWGDEQTRLNGAPTAQVDPKPPSPLALAKPQNKASVDWHGYYQSVWHGRFELLLSRRSFHP
jgi:hypothetical protein